MKHNDELFTKRIKADKRFDVACSFSILLISIICLTLVTVTLLKSTSAFSYYFLNVPRETNLTLEKSINKLFGDQTKDIIKLIPDYDNLKTESSLTLPFIKLNYEVKSFLNKKESALPKNFHNMVMELYKQNIIIKKADFSILTNNDSAYPEFAGMKNGLIGSFKVVLLSLIITIPIGVMTGIFIEELCINKKIKTLIETSVNVMVGIPSVIYGILGLTCFINFMNVPRSSIIVASLTLALMSLPLVIITTTQSLRAIPDSIRFAAFAMGASRIQVILHHLIKLAIPGIASGIILSLIRIIGETAPLIMVGMVAFIANNSLNFSDPTTVLPVQIYLWSGNIEKEFEEKIFAAIYILILIMCILNSLIHKIRRNYERKWQ